MTRRRRLADDDEGSVLILTLGYAALALVAVLVCVDATSLYLSQKRLDALADAAALAAADGFELSVESGEPVAVLTSDGVRAQAEEIVTAAGGGAVLVSAGTPDGVSARVTVAGSWHPPVLTLFVPDGVALESTATSRTALR
ncbi:pilus assembly protein TadG-related protein [Microbacterium thalassium]|uniref:pilus assembly protein TadG-related protein n=1 Tax=Microbacterium TaxID=33882 RepID=UPI00146E9D6B|nr:pilus assembly protein TadG-related protein [Microbacterium thalassium]